MATPPKVDAFVVCSHVHKDPVSRRFTLVGTASAVTALQFPSGPIELGVYFSLTGLNGAYEFGVQVVAPDLVTELAHFVFDRLSIGDPLSRTELGLRFAGLEFPAAGRYTLRLRYNARTAAEFTMDVRLPRQEGA